MKRLILFIVLGLSVTSFMAAQSLKGKTAYVTARKLELKSSTAFFADVLGALSYGDQVTVQDEYQKWAKVQTTDKPSLNGWVASSSLTTKRIIASDGTSASASEIALAGKGFNQEVENAYRQSEKLNYDAIDAMEASGVPNRQLYNFLLEGHLARGE
ncbi:conserved hypothetical protein [Treponema primitia ZAS-2]|uniref:SH3b domain-containing protein n=1 Tax=Treponema primitia (strain ATCC BAA-887 / DSM 12427 / ZAS-2) TaxID=545694 RepID=F5YN76_TREPZ|nr:SH3 domain-containing protein [Treponema primitia]AEF87004.1 conserved hypothetical protein [Treponema primitia ZAS-2]